MKRLQLTVTTHLRQWMPFLGVGKAVTPHHPAVPGHSGGRNSEGLWTPTGITERSYAGNGRVNDISGA